MKAALQCGIKKNTAKSIWQYYRIRTNISKRKQRVPVRKNKNFEFIKKIFHQSCIVLKLELLG